MAEPTTADRLWQAYCQLTERYRECLMQAQQRHVNPEQACANVGADVEAARAALQRARAEELVAEAEAERVSPNSLTR